MDAAFFFLLILALIVGGFIVVARLWFNNQRFEREQMQRAAEGSTNG